MYRILEEHAEVRERRDPHYQKPELLATAPNQVWVILDIFSRYGVGWMAAPRESSLLAERLIGETLESKRPAN